MLDHGGTSYAHGFSVRSALVLAAVLALGAILAVTAPSAASASPSNSHEKAQIRKHKKAQHRRKTAHARKHKKAQARKHRQTRGDGPKAHGPVELAPGVTESPNGWIHYEPDPVGEPVESEELTRVEGSPAPEGDGCAMDDASSMPPRGQELIREEIAYNRETCESVFLERLIGTPDRVQTRVIPGDPGTVKYASGHNMQLWVDPVGITITGLNIDLHWPLYGAKGTWTAKPYSYKFALDGWRAGKTQLDDPLPKVHREKEYDNERMWGTAQAGAPTGGYRGVAHRRFENIDFYEAVRTAKLGWTCPEGNDDVDKDGKTDWTVFEHEVQVAGYYSGRMGTWQHNSKTGPCSWMVKKRERVNWGLKRDNFPREVEMPLNSVLPWNAFVSTGDEVVFNESTDPVPYDLLPTEINQNSVKLEGGVNPRGVSTNWWAQCGTTTAYGMWVSGQVNIGSGTSSVPVSVTVPNLQPNTTYHCRMVALNVQGQAAFSADEEFTTQAATPPGPLVSTDEAYQLRQRSATISGFVNPMGKPTRYYFQYGYSAELGYGSTVPIPPGSEVGSGINGVYVTNDVTGLEAEKTYHYRIVASNADGTTYGNDRTFSTLGRIPPDATTEEASEISRNSARLNATIDPNGDDTHYFIEYGKAGAGNYEATVPAGSSGGSAGSGVDPVAVSQPVTGLAAGTTYRYRVTASNGSGFKQGGERTFTTVGPGIEVLPPGEVTQSKVTMEARVDGVGVPTTYYFDYGITDAYGSKTEEKAIPAGSGFQPVSAALEGLSVGWTVHYRIVAKSSQGTTTGPDQVVTTAWSNEPSFGPEAESVSDWLKDVSCVSANSCVAVGGFLNSDPPEMPNPPLWVTNINASLWDGTEWKSIEPASPVTFFSELKGVSCVSATNCIAVGVVLVTFTESRPLVMQWDGKTWTELATPQSPPGVNYSLSDVSCPAANSCEAVGFSSVGIGTSVRPLAMHWDGSNWTVRSSANPNTPGGEPSKEESLLESVSCASPTFCKAVGGQLSVVGGVASRKPLIERLSGSEWVTEAADTAAYPATETGFWLESVSCPTIAACLAVGYSGPSPNQQDTRPKKAFTQRWNGTQWQNRSVPQGANQATELYDVSCSSATTCRAVSKEGRGLQWSGSQWTLQAPKPPGDTYRFKPTEMLNGISCPTATACQAVGSYLPDSGPGRRLTLGWSGSGAAPEASWTVATAIGQTSATLNGRVNPAGVDAGYYFEYGPTTSYGTKTPEASAGSGNFGPKVSDWPMVSTPVTDLVQGRTYHYRVVVTNGTSTAYGQDTVFTTKSTLAESPVTEAFNGASTEISDFATKWAPLQWAGSTRKGKNNANGYGPVDTALNGAYFLPTVTDSGGGVAAQATLAAAPGSGGHVSLWLDMSNPAVEKRGYELNFIETATNTYTVALKRYFGSNVTVLGNQTSFSLPPGSQMALADQGGEVSAWAHTGSGYVKVLGAADTIFNTGAAGVEIQGASTTRLTNFKLGTIAEQVTYPEQAVKSIPLIDAFNRTESPLSLSNSWVALNWAMATVKTGKVDLTAGWTPTEYSTAPAGAYWQKTMASDTGTGDAVMVTNTNYSSPGSPYYAALWLNAPSPGTVKSGYQLRIAGTGGWLQELKLYKWVNGTPTLLGSKTVEFPGGAAGAKYALVDKGNAISVWSSPSGGNLTSAFSATDTTYSYGYSGVEGAGPTGLKEFKLGQLPRSQY